MSALTVGKGRDALVFTDVRGGASRTTGRGYARPRWPSAARPMTLNVYAHLFDEDLDGVADRLDAAIESAADPLRTVRGP